MRRSSSVIACSAVLSTALTACTAAPDPDAPADAGKRPGYLAVADKSVNGRGPLTVQVDYDSVEAGGLDPQLAGSARSWSLGSLVYEPLVTVGASFEIKPLLAKSWTQPDPTTYVFTLRDGARFSNGRAVTTADVVGSLKRLAASKAPYGAQLGPVKTVRATGPAEVTVELKKPYGAFLSALSNTPAAVLPMKEIENGSIDIKKQMLGTGPFSVREHKQDRHWTFAPNPKYRFADKVGVSEIRVEIVPQESARLAAVRSGNAGLAFFNNVDSMDQLTGTPNAKVVNQQYSDFYYLIQNSQNPTSPLADQKVRFALNSALDRQQIADNALGGQSRPTGVAPSALPGGCEPGALPAAKAGVGSAEAAVKAAGAQGTTLRIAVYTSEPALAQIAQVVQQQYAAAGVKVKIEKFDDATYGERVFGAKPDFDLAIGWFAGYADASMVSRWWNPSVAGFSSVFLKNDTELNALIDTASAQAPGAERNSALRAVCEKVDTNAEMLPLVSRPGVVGYRTDKVSPTLHAREGYGNLLRNITEFTIPGAK
ncbi:ABC transporter substrate-binding protein [Streptomyces sp. NPDC059578]|uniref:ABC transporter substrate-binding protein n=1 Tax=Streptomyces sp. NPDC059578 TaxID=3346874 RepID=UPI0036987CA3